MEFSEKIKLLLKENGMTQKEFALKVSMNYAHANKFFTGRTPNMEFLNKVMEAFPDVDLKWLLFGHEETVLTVRPEEKQITTNDQAIEYINQIENTLDRLRAVLTQN